MPVLPVCHELTVSHLKSWDDGVPPDVAQVTVNESPAMPLAGVTDGVRVITAYA